MAHDGPNVGELRDSWYQSLDEHALIPQLELKDFDPIQARRAIYAPNQPEKLYFPLGLTKKRENLQSGRLTNPLVFTVSGGRTFLSLSPISPKHLKHDRDLLTFLVIMIYSRCCTQELESYAQIREPTDRFAKNSMLWATLPGKNMEKLRDVLFEFDDVSFLNVRDTFCTMNLYPFESFGYDLFRTPHMKETLIGDGALGKVFRTVIAPEHFQDMPNVLASKTRFLARKELKLSNRSTSDWLERKYLWEIMQTAAEHKNIVRSFGTFQVMSVYSVMQPLADCDLQQYMETYPHAPQDWNQKLKIVKAVVGLVAAVNHLHTQLQSSEGEKLTCFDLGLKPQKILVFIDLQTGVEQWKLSDFNLCRVNIEYKLTGVFPRLRRNHTFRGRQLDLRKSFIRRKLHLKNSDADTGSAWRRGTYSAPETYVEDQPLGPENDIWSLGCVISMVFTYLYVGAEVITDFSETRFN